MELGQHNYIGIYPLTALPNTPFGTDEYIKKYELVKVDIFRIACRCHRSK